MKITKRSFIGWICAVTLLLSSNVFSQGILEDEIWIPVTYYDFHSDTSNPEFEQPHPSIVRKGMVQSRLDKDGLPVPTTNPDSILLNSYMKYWYRPFKSGDFTIPVYNGGTGRLIRTDVVDYDTAFINKVIKDSLRFVRVPGTNMYRFDTTQFFPLDKYSPPASFGVENPRVVPNHNYAFTMHLHFTFTKTEDAQTFRFRGDDDVWAFIDSTLVMDLGGIHEPAEGSFTVSNSLQTNKEYSFDLFFAERHTTMSNIRIETNLFKHDTNVIEINMESDTACAVQPNIITASVTSDGEYSKVLSEKVKWIIRGENGQSTIKGNMGSSGGYQIGDTLIFYPTEAYTTDTIIATTYDTILGVDVPISSLVHVKPCNPHHLSIEEVTLADSAGIVIAVKPNLTDNDPINSIPLVNVTKGYAFAVVRDSAGNYMGLADKDNTTWSSIDDIITVTATPDSAYKGIITKMKEESHSVAIVKMPNLIPDSVDVNLSSECITKLRLKDQQNQIVTSIKMHTGERKVYTAEGLKAGTVDDWVVTEAKWELESPPEYSIKTPKQDSRWTFDPTTPGTSTLYLSRPFVDTNMCVEKPDLEIPVTVTIEPIQKVELTILTSADKRIAGDTLLAEVRIYNTDGLIPGKYCLGNGGNETQQVIYNDLLANPSHRNLPNPRITVEGNWTDLNQGLSSTIKHNECFDGGIDTIKFVAYYAPFPYDRTDSVHILRVDVGNNHTDQKEFRLRPATADKIDITDEDLKSITGTEVFGYNQSAKIYTSIIYDKYGNVVMQKPLVDNWYTTGTINNLSSKTAAEFEFYPGENAQIQTGTVVAKHRMDNKDLIDSIDIRVNTIPAEITDAVTRDTSGNGFIDMIELTFNKEVIITDEMITDFKITYSSTTFKVVDIVKTDDSGTEYKLIIEEVVTETPKTDMRPVLTTTAGSKAGFKDVANKQTSDGVAPVVISAQIHIKDHLNHSNDILTIKLSESVKKADGQKLNVNDIPGVSFSTWYKDPNTSAVTLVTLLDSISGYSSADYSVVEIRMTNGRLLSTNNLINIRAETKSISDQVGNFPDSNNVKVPVSVVNKEISVIAGPIPAVVSFAHTKPGEFKIVHDQEAMEYAKNNMGIAFRINVPYPEVSKGEKLSCVIKVYDHVGNNVFVSEEENIVPEAMRSQKVDRTDLQMDIYWNGSNSKGMAISPGIYRIVFYFAYSMNPQNNQKVPLNIGFRK